MPAFTSHEGVAQWLDGKPRDISAVLAVRGALRGVPVLARMRGLNRGSHNGAERTVLQIFRTLAAGWSIAAFPGHSLSLRQAAVSSITGSSTSNVQRAAENATAAAAGAETDAAAADFAASSVNCSIDAVAAEGRRAFDDLLNSYAADADILDQGYSPVTLALSSTLWPSVPDWAFDGWAQLERALLDVNGDWEA